MIPLDDLRIKQAEFEGTRQKFKKEIIKLEDKRQKFLKLFPKEKLSNLKLENYALQKEDVGSKSSFCYWLENELKELGNIHGATARKFGIYFGVSKSEPTEYKWRITSRFGDSKEEAFNNIKSAIITLLNYAGENNIQGIRDNSLSNLFKGKILSTYFPDKFLNIFDDKHLEYFLDKLDLVYSDSDDEISKRIILINFKNKDEIMSKWTIYEFSKFLYDSFGHPSRREDAPQELKEYLENKTDYPKIKEVNAEFIELNINQENIEIERKETKPLGKVVDFEKENKINKLLGTRGEEIVFNLEQRYLNSIGKQELANKVKWVSKEDDSLGYDILSFEEDGKEKYIEVKSTSQSEKGNANFLISSNQYSKAKRIKNYYFYIVFNTKGKEPKVWKIKEPLQYENKGLTLTPIGFRVVINTRQLS
ncbi:hypothetical protein COU58_02585 [Candidatus Pacearchaeota archaeon CG10_big_fil_rev_8_21_14_0_10_32_42]|nr:MAG: hypothetical protein COU58_02585 [Candidatus Pacearchaeota archaeon CG10_big_fil_rev_8_21_14_0_10_32_42]